MATTTAKPTSSALLSLCSLCSSLCDLCVTVPLFFAPQSGASPSLVIPTGAARFPLARRSLACRAAQWRDQGNHRPLCAHLPLLTSHFLLLTSYFSLLTSHFLLLTSYFCLLTISCNTSPAPSSALRGTRTLPGTPENSTPHYSPGISDSCVDSSAPACESFPAGTVRTT